MKTKTYIHIRDFCQGHGLEPDFLYRLREFELIRILEVEAGEVIEPRELPRLERLVRLHRDLELEPQGLVAVEHLRQQVEALQEEVRQLRTRLGRWEGY